MNGMNSSRKIGEQTNKFIIKAACKVGVFCSANDLDVETDQELGRSKNDSTREVDGIKYERKRGR